MNPTIMDEAQTAKRQARRHLLTLALIGALAPLTAHAAEDPEALQPKYTQFPPEDGHLRPMHIHQVNALGLEIWTEAEPEWDTELIAGSGGNPPVFAASSPDNYHPPAAITVTAWRKERVPRELFETMADTAIRTASANYGLNKGAARAIQIEPATWGLLEGYEGRFSGRTQGTRVDVRLFVGQQDGKYPVVTQIYTQAGKMDNLNEIIRRCWSNISYL